MADGKSKRKKPSLNLAERRSRRSLFAKYYLSIAALVAAALLFMGFFLTVVVSAQWWNDRVDELRENAKDLALTIENDAQSLKDADLRADISATVASITGATASEYFITDTSGRIVICPESGSDFAYDTDCKEHSKLVMDEDYMTRALKDGFSQYSNSDYFGYGVFILAVPVKDGDAAVGAVFAVEDAVSGLVPYVFNILQTVFIVTLVALVVAFFIIYFICRDITDPIAEMRSATKHFARGDFEYRARQDYKEEYLNQFSHSLNRMADELARENEMQKSFVANVSHELKTPMTTIGGFVDAIRDGTIPPETQSEYLDIVSGEVKRLSRMVQAMLNLSKIESGEIGISLSEFDISSMVFNTLLSFEQIVDEKHVNVVGFENMKSVKVKADKDLIQQVVYNLIDNAVKFVDENGTISVKCAEDEKGVRVSIRNTGKTIPNDEISKIFDRFYKVDKSRSFDKNGVGLGLYIVKTVINMHEGEISASSKENEWTQFEFALPVSE